MFEKFSAAGSGVCAAPAWVDGPRGAFLLDLIVFCCLRLLAGVADVAGVEFTTSIGRISERRGLGGTYGGAVGFSRCRKPSASSDWVRVNCRRANATTDCDLLSFCRAGFQDTSWSDGLGPEGARVGTSR